jgi:hypothetical protein
MALNIIVPLPLLAGGSNLRSYLLRRHNLDLTDLLLHTLELWDNLGNDSSVELHQRLSDHFTKYVDLDRMTFEEYQKVISVLAKALHSFYAALEPFLNPVLDGRLPHCTPKLRLGRMVYTDFLIEADAL